MDIEEFRRISEKKALVKKEAFKSLAEEESVGVYENERGKILIGEKGDGQDERYI